ncbi:MAG: hypothetical protein HYR62_07515 [Actinobacteria bacterium]|nr:hypothetical protein [Actinomycetota bacterium]MBI3686165.1 hypothetical protein [Actinomycetota bacterium]
MTGILHAVTAPTPLTLPQALDWWRDTPSTSAHPMLGEPVGFALSANAATWWRLDPATPPTPRGPHGPLDLAGAYELLAFDGHRELRWLHTDAGHGHAVALAEDPDLLPLGNDVTDPRTPTAIGSHHRMLAGQPTPLTAGWVTVGSARYDPAAVPVDLTSEAAAGTGADQIVLILESVDYAVEDEHGNRTVTDTRRLHLAARARRDLRASTLIRDQDRSRKDES